MGAPLAFAMGGQLVRARSGRSVPAGYGGDEARKIYYLARIWVPKQRPEIGRKMGPITVSFGARFLLILYCGPIFAPRFRPQIW